MLDLYNLIPLFLKPRLEKARLFHVTTPEKLHIVIKRNSNIECGAFCAFPHYGKFPNETEIYKMQTNTFSLNSLPVGKRCRVAALLSDGKQRRRMLDLGLIQGTNVEALQRSPSGDPVAYYIRGAVIALRDEDANKILVQYCE